jgi:carbon-monoxide dehydrogenase medium subunit
MKPALFDYHSPATIEEAVALLANHDGAMILAGGQSLVPAMNMRLANPAALVDIQRIPGLSRIAADGGVIRVGAMVRHRELELDPAAHAANPLIREAMAHVAHVPIRNRGTVVGSLCHADAAAEMPLILVLTGGSVLARSAAGERVIHAEDYFEFHMTTTRRPDEMIVEARFPSLPQGAGHAFEEFTRRHGDYAIVAVGCILTRTSDGSIDEVSLAACGITSRPVRLREAEAALRGRPLVKETLEKAARAAAEAVTTGDDMHATAAYRKHLAGVLVKRAVEKSATRAHGAPT